jgi:WD40 repeat protein
LDRPVISENYRACTLNFESLPEKKSAVEHAFRESMFGHTPRKVLSFGAQRQQASHDSILTVISPSKTPTTTRRATRKRPAKPSRILDAPGLVDDFYINPLAWSSGNVLAIALDDRVFTGDISYGETKVNLVYSAPEGHYASSVEWLDTRHLAVGISSGRVKIIDVEEAKVIRSLKCHADRVSAMSWSPMNCLSSGGRDRNLVHSDLRQEHHVVSRIRAHSSEICQVRWSPNEKNLATGGNDDRVLIWDVASMANPTVVFDEHKAAVKAIAWNPHDFAMIATGGGTKDKTIKLWNSRNGNVRKSVNAGAQVCCMMWNPHVVELLTGQGFGVGGCRLSLWKCPSLTRIQTFESLKQDCRPIAMALCPSGSKVCVASTDECVRIWDMFEPLHSKAKAEDDLPLSNGFWDSMQIR